MRSWPILKAIKRLGYRATVRQMPGGAEVIAVNHMIPERWHLVRSLDDSDEQLHIAVCRLAELVRSEIDG